MESVTVQFSQQDIALLRELLSMATASGGINANRIARASLYLEDKIDAAIKQLTDADKKDESLQSGG